MFCRQNVIFFLLPGIYIVVIVSLKINEFSGKNKNYVIDLFYLNFLLNLEATFYFLDIL